MFNDHDINTLNDKNSQLYSLFFNGLTLCELAILPFVYHNLPVKAMGSQLGLSERTITNRLGVIFEKLEVSNQIELRHLIANRRDHYEFFQRKELIDNQSKILDELMKIRNLQNLC